MVPSFPVTVYVDVDEGFRWGSVSGCGDTAHIEKDGLYTLQVFSKQCELEGHAFYGLDYTEAHSGPLEMREGEVVWRAELFKPPLIVLEPDEREEKYDRWMETMDESLDRFEDSQLKHIAQLEYFIELAERLQQAAPEDSEDWTNLAKKRSTFERKIESISIETLDEEEESQTERLDWIEQRFGE